MKCGTANIASGRPEPLNAPNIKEYAMSSERNFRGKCNLTILRVGITEAVNELNTC